MTLTPYAVLAAVNDAALVFNQLYALYQQANAGNEVTVDDVLLAQQARKGAITDFERILLEKENELANKAG